jgi:hypothetical protein
VHERGEPRARRDRAAQLLEQHAQLEEAHPHAAVGLGHRDAEQVRVRELRPERGVEPGSVALGCLETLGRHLGAEDLGRERADRPALR